MLPRNRTILLMLVLCFIWGSTALAADNLFIRFYQEHISVVDGNRCSMYPSCSAYASQTFKKHGVVVGWIMACDRLVRCGRDEALVSMQVKIDNTEFTYDPVSANDFWWFETKPNTIQADTIKPDKIKSNETKPNETN